MWFSLKRITKALISLRGCADWSAPVLIANPRRQIFSRWGPINMIVCYFGSLFGHDYSWILKVLVSCDLFEFFINTVWFWIHCLLCWLRLSIFITNWAKQRLSFYFLCQRYMFFSWNMLFFFHYVSTFQLVGWGFYVYIVLKSCVWVLIWCLIRFTLLFNGFWCRLCIGAVHTI